MPLLSICIAAYNQSALVAWNLEQILSYRGDDIEVILSDDCSSEDLEGIAACFNDYRIHYIKTEINSGHDKNILNAIRHASGKYVLVLRSRDTVLSDAVPNALDILKNCHAVSYVVFSAVDEDGNEKLKLSDKRYSMGKSAIKAHEKLFVHPSGNIYRRDLINVDVLERVIDCSFSHRFGFVVHDLLRMDLACHGDFVTSSLVFWQYSNTAKQHDMAVNSLGNGRSVYCSDLGYERCECEIRFVNKVLHTDELNKRLLNQHIIWFYFRGITRDYPIKNKDKDLQKHYGFKEVRSSYSDERVNFRKFIRKMNVRYNMESDFLIEVFLCLYSVKLTLWYPIRDKLLKAVYRSPSVVRSLRRL